MSLILSNDFSTKTIISGDDIQEEFENVANKFNANIVNADINADAAISLDKLAGQYQYLILPVVQSPSNATDPSDVAGVVLGTAIIPAISGDSPWTLSRMFWCADVSGTTDAKIDLEYGEYSAGAFSVAVSGGDTFGPYTLTSEGSSGATGGTQLIGEVLTPLTSVSVIRAVVDTAGTGWTHVNFHVSVELKRAIQA